MMRQWLIGMLVGLTLTAGATAGEATAQGDKATFRVGTFKRQEVLVAFYRSKHWEGELQKLLAQVRKAEAEGDQKQVAALKAKGAALQEEAHRQLVGKAPLTNVLDHLKSALPAIAKEAGVPLIVEEPLFRDPSVEAVDITPLLIKRMPPAERKGK